MIKFFLKFLRVRKKTPSLLAYSIAAFSGPRSHSKHSE